MKIHHLSSPPEGNKDSRIQIKHLVLHSDYLPDLYTSSPVTTHYAVSDYSDSNGEVLIHEFVRPEYRNELSRCIGSSSWQGNNRMNFSSIGICLFHRRLTKERELLAEQRKLMIADQHSVNQTPLCQDRQGHDWLHFPKEQIAALIEFAGSLVKQYKIEPTCVLGYADLLPGRTPDPGPLFPWYTLAHEGIGAWPRAAVVEYYEKRLKERPLTLAQQKSALKQYGYEIFPEGLHSIATKNTMASFQVHFSPTDYLGNMDNSSQAVLCALIEDYYPQAMETILGAQLPSSGVSGPAVNSQRFLESIASYPVDEAAQPSAATASKDQLFKPAGLCQLFNLT